MATKPVLSLKTQLKKADPGIRLYLFDLRRENLALHRTIAKLETKNLSQHNRIKALEKAIKEDAPQVHINIGDLRKTKEQVIAGAIEALRADGYTVIPPTDA